MWPVVKDLIKRSTSHNRPPLWTAGMQQTLADVKQHLQTPDHDNNNNNNNDNKNEKSVVGQREKTPVVGAAPQGGDKQALQRLQHLRENLLKTWAPHPLSRRGRRKRKGAPPHGATRGLDNLNLRERRVHQYLALCVLDPTARLAELADLGRRWPRLAPAARRDRLAASLAALRRRRAWHLLTEACLLDLRMYLLTARLRLRLGVSAPGPGGWARQEEEQARAWRERAVRGEAVSKTASKNQRKKERMRLELLELHQRGGIADVAATWCAGPEQEKRKRPHIVSAKLLKLLEEGWVVAVDRTPPLTGTTTTQPSGDASSDPSSSLPDREADGGAGTKVKAKGKTKGKTKGKGKGKGKGKAEAEAKDESTTAAAEPKERRLPFWQLPVYTDERYYRYARVANLSLMRERVLMEYRVAYQDTQLVRISDDMRAAYAKSKSPALVELARIAARDYQV